MANDMITFFSGLLEAVAHFLGSEPMIYFTSLFALILVLKAFKGFLR